MDSLPAPKYGDLLFSKLPSDSYGSEQIKLWAARAGIQKNVTWHTSRHTFGVLFLDSGGDIYALQQFYGHGSVSTTQIYADMSNAKRQAQINLIPALEYSN